MHTGDTIAAISSAVGPGARMIVRLSGSSAFQIARKLTSQSGLSTGAARSLLSFDGLRVPAWIYSFRAPRSVTGEDVVELHVPGNVLLVRMLLAKLIEQGARHAEAGEFTARAYFGGKLDLAEAEGVAATIAAASERELAAARQLLAGELSRRLAPIMDALAEALALVEAGIDFSDEDISFISTTDLQRRIRAAGESLSLLLTQSARFERLAHEPAVVLAGLPNAGKSTLLNALGGFDRAVVSAAEGTTRDAIWVHVTLPRGIVRVIDVAGLDERTADELGRQMQQAALREIEIADAVVLVHAVDEARPRPGLPREPNLIARTKSDLPGTRPPVSDREISVSALTGQGLDTLRVNLDRVCFGEVAAGAVLALNARHIECVTEAREALDQAVDSADQGAELAALHLRDALDALGRILGSVTPDDVLGLVFGRFCVGK